MASPGISTSPATLFIGNVAPGGVSIGTGGALTLDNTVTPAAAAFAGTLAVSGLLSNRVVSIRASKSGFQSLSFGVATAVTWDELAAGGGAQNFPGFTSGASAFTIPTAGTYLIVATVQWGNGVSSPGTQSTYFQVGTASIGTPPLYGLAGGSTVTGYALNTTSSFVYQFSGGEQVRFVAIQSAGGSTGVGGSSGQTLSIVRLGS